MMQYLKLYLFVFPRSIAEETVGELEKEKTMKELEMRDALAQHRGELASRDALVQGLRDRDHENRATIDLQRKVCMNLLRNTHGPLPRGAPRYNPRRASFERPSTATILVAHHATISRRS